VNEWLRKANYKIALLTNGQQWRLIHAGVDYDAWCEWDIGFWLKGEELGLQAIALQSLLNVRSLTYASKDKPSPLITAINASRQGQAELSDVLGERVRKAVELLIESSSSGISQLLEGNCAGTTLTPRHFYIAATRTIMRLVIILFAEARDLLPRENGIYHNSYGIQGLREQLDRLSGGRGAERLRSSESAWARVLALFRLVYLGSAHEKLPIPAYGGSLFAPSDRLSDDPILIALSAFENLGNCPSDAVVHKILELLTRSKVKVRQGRGSTWVEAPVDFSDLSSEYIGILYEGLLDFELRQADRDQPMVFLNLGDQPVLPLTRLENMTDKAIASLVEKLKQKDESGGEEDEEGEEGVGSGEWAVDGEEMGVGSGEMGVGSGEWADSENPTPHSLIPTPHSPEETDRYQQVMARSQAWAERAVKVGKLVSGRLKGKAYEDTARQLAKALVVRVVLPEAWYLVRWGGTRKGSGTFYTRPQLAVPTVRQTLLSLVYEGSGDLAVGSGDLGVGFENLGVANGGTVLSGFTSLARGDESGRDVLSLDADFSEGGDLRTDITSSESGGISASEYSRGLRTGDDGRVYSFSEDRSGFSQGTGDTLANCGEDTNDSITISETNSATMRISGKVVESVDSGFGGEEWGVGSGDLAVGSGELGVGSGGDDGFARSGSSQNSKANIPHSPLPTPHLPKNPKKHSPLPTPHSPENLIPKPPEIILSLKICDPAMGSGSFPVAAVRFLTEALYASLWHYGKIEAHGDRTLCRLADGTGTNSLLDETLPLLPDHDDFEERLKARLKRYVVERCIYGVDLDPLAVELAKMALWIETMDRSLAFGFLDHKLKCGNALVGCWFDQFREYPVMAWERKGGDETHKPVHHFREHKGKQVGDKWTQAIKDLRNGEVKEQLKSYLEVLNPQMRLDIPEVYLPEPPEQIYAQALELFNKLHGDLHQPDFQQEQYKLGIEKSEAFQKLRQAFDLWCAIWFWSGQYLDKDLDIAPTPNHFFNPSEQVREIANNIAKEFRFFHWEIEFPDVFAGAGFDAVIGNPPWEIQKPNSKEFFSNIDPLYRTYGKQEALDYQKQYFTNNPQIETDWIAYGDRLKALGNYFKYAGFAFGDPTVGDGFTLSRKKSESENLHDLWRERRQKYLSYAEKIHPFRYQGSADINTYKLFLEFGLGILRSGGKLGLIVPSGVYTDKGSTDLRTLFLERNQWEWLFGFENRDGIFNIHRSFKFCPVIVIKGGKTENIKATFMQRSLSTWENPDRYVLNYPAARVAQFSPNSKAILEIRSDRDLLVLEKMYANGILLGDQSDRGWGIKYATEFHMTADSKLFPPRPQWEAKGYRADEYGHWLKGDWCVVGSGDLGVGSGDLGVGSGDLGVGSGDLGVGSGGDSKPYSLLPNPDSPQPPNPESLIFSSDRTHYIKISNVEDVALPLYEGRMIGQFDFSQKGWVSGKGRTAVWQDMDFNSKFIQPQYLMGLKSLINDSPKGYLHPKVTYMSISSATNSRTTYSTYLNIVPAGHSISFFRSSLHSSTDCLLVVGFFGTFTFDYQIRVRLGGLNMSEFVMSETALPSRNKLSKIQNSFIRIVSSLAIPHQSFACDWQKLSAYISQKYNWYSLWAITPYERLRLRSILDAIVAELYGLEIEDFAWILKDSDLPKEQINDKTYSRTLDAKGFWRIDKDKDPELRHTVLSQIAFQELKKIGLEAFLNLNNGEGWMIPDQIRLADYGLGHDHRAQTHQPVAERLGARYLDWQLQSTPEASWLECERHAANLQKLLCNNPTPNSPTPNAPPIQTDLFGNPLQTDLFGNIIDSQAGKK